MTRKMAFLLTAVTVMALSAPAWAQMSGRGGSIAPNGNPRSGLFIPGLPIEPRSSRPYIDYVVNIQLPGLYRIDCVSSNGGTFDPYVRLFRGGRQIAANNNGGGGVNARIQTILIPGRYVIRVSTLRQGAIPIPTPFTLRVSSQTIPGGIPTPAMPEQLPLNIPIPQLK